MNIHNKLHIAKVKKHLRQAVGLYIASRKIRKDAGIPLTRIEQRIDKGIKGLTHGY